MYDIIVITDNKDNDTYASLKNRFPLVKIATSVGRARAKSFTKCCWIVWGDLKVVDTFNFDYVITPGDEQWVHVFKHNDAHTNGICLIPNKVKISDREEAHRFFIDKKEIDIQASTVKPYDIIFISYNEPNADKNYERVKSRFENVKRVHGVKGIHRAHIEAAKLSTTPMFWVVDGDAEIVDNFNFELVMPSYDFDAVCVWRSKNPINNLEYGYGGIKLLPTAQTLAMDVNSADMTTSISKKFKPINEVSNITVFNTDPFNTWKSAFRECVKLSSTVIQSQVNAETADRLHIWCTDASGDYAKDALNGANAGKEYGLNNADNLPALLKINDFDWLEQQFKQTLVL